MIIVDCVQGSPEWQMARCGIVTASNLDRVITPKTMKPSASMEKYAYALLAEQLLGVPMEGGSSGFTERGSIVERKARTFYEMQKDVDVEEVGFILRDDERVGCSPDGFVGDDGLLELKVPKPETHISYLLDDEGIGYRCQCQGQLWVTGRQWVDTVSYHPDMPAAIVRVQRDEAFIAALAKAVDQMLAFMDDSKLKLQQRFGMFPDFKLADLRVVA